MQRSLVFGVAGAAIAAVVVAGATLADDEDRGGRLAPAQCVSSPLKDTRILDDRTLYIEDRNGRAALLHMTSGCLLSDHEAIGVEYSPGSSSICGPLDVDITGTVMTVPVACMIRSVEALSREEAQAIRKGR